MCWSQPIKQCCGWTNPCGSYYDCKTPFSNNHWETLKKIKVCYLQDLEITQHWGLHNKFMCRETEACVSLGFCFYWGRGGGPRFSWAHCLLVNLNLLLATFLGSSLSWPGFMCSRHQIPPWEPHCLGPPCQAAQAFTTRRQAGSSGGTGLWSPQKQLSFCAV